MALLGLEIEKAPKGLRQKRFLAFMVDGVILLLLLSLAFELTGVPDFFAVRVAMDAASTAATPDAALSAAVFDTFNASYSASLLIWFGYEVVTQLLLGGSTLGKLLLGLRVVAANPARKPSMQLLMLVLRSALKMLALYLFQGIPFIICYLTLFTNPQCNSGFDKTVRTTVVRRRTKKELVPYENSDTDPAEERRNQSITVQSAP